MRSFILKLQYNFFDNETFGSSVNINIGTDDGGNERISIILATLGDEQLSEKIRNVNFQQVIETEMKKKGLFKESSS